MRDLTKDSHPGYIPALDGIRGLAILMVTVWHYFYSLHSWFPGWSGVDLFFVLSGYLITGRLIQTKGTPGFFLGFYRNRALRILPLYFLMLIAFFTILHLFIKNNLSSFAIYTGHWPSFFIFTENWTFIRFGFPRDLSLLPLWSIAVEEQFYLFWPLIILLIPSGKSRIWIFSAAIFLTLLSRSLCYRITASPYQCYYNTFFRLDGMLAGSLLYQLHYSRINIPLRLFKWITAVLLIALIAGSYLSKSVSPYSFFNATAGYTLIALFFTCLLHMAVQSEWQISRFLKMGFLRYLGKISYALYLVHVPILLFLGTRLHFWGMARWPERPALVHWTSVIASLLLSIVISVISYRYFESWFLRFKKTPNFKP